jgi:hypothetical protein
MIYGISSNGGAFANIYQNPFWNYRYSLDAVGGAVSPGTYNFSIYQGGFWFIGITGIKTNTYVPVAAPNPQTSSTSGAGFFATGTITPQSSGNIIVTCVAFASSNGDSFTSAGTPLRTSVVPTVTSAAAAIIDSYAEDTVAANNQVRFNASRNWASFSFELNSGNSTKTVTPDGALVQTSSFSPPVVTDYKQLQSGGASFSYTGKQLLGGEVVIPYEPPHFEQSAGGASIYISGTQLSNGTVSFAYSETLTANGGFPPYTWTLLSGSLPPGLSLGPSTGIITGTPTTAGTYTFTVEATDSLSNIATNTFSITIGMVISGGGSTVFIY